MKPNGLHGPESGLRAQRLDNRNPAKQYGTGRTCEECGIPISRYNPDSYCHAHARFFTGSGKRGG
jgi:hypothetical protein